MYLKNHLSISWFQFSFPLGRGVCASDKGFALVYDNWRPPPLPPNPGSPTVVPSKSNVPSLWPWPLTYEGQFFQWIEYNLSLMSSWYNPISILYKFQIHISSNSREIKYQNIGRTHRHTHRQTDTQTHTDRQTWWKQYLATPSGGEVIRWFWHRSSIVKILL